MGDTAKLLIELAIIVVLIAGIAQFRSPAGARRGNYTAAFALALAIVFVLVDNDVRSWAVIVPAFLVGAAAGWLVAVRVNMIQIPALVAFQHGAGGVAALLVSFVELTRTTADLTPIGTVSAYVGLIVGSATFAGSMIAAAKLANKIKQQPTVFKHHNAILLLIIAVGAGLTAGAILNGGALQSLLLLGLVATSMILGVVFAIRIGGADMPVLISFLNATAGLAAAFVGVVIESTLLIAAGATVASSGSILTWVMCTGMNRSLLNVLIGQKKAKAGAANAPAAKAPATPATTPAAADTPQSRALAALRAADSVIVVPGYGMAQAHAAFEVVRLANLLEKEGKQVRFAVHPVAGRMPGHMHVLLAEAEVEYEKLFEMKDINDDFASTDVVLVVGACDVVNPAAISTEDTPISGMPILKAHEAGAVIVCNLDEKPGYSGVENPLYEDPKAILLFGDAKGTLEGLVVGLEAPATPATTPAAADTPQSRALAALRAADSVIVVPGYGMAQAHAAFEVVRLANLLEKEGKQVRFAVHPVAGRMPGHMHVLLAEAEVEYEKLFEMKDINDDFASTDVVLVVGACDVVNPAAISTEDTPISGMPILKAHEAGAVIVCNLDEKPGYSGVENPLYEDPKAILLFGDAKGTLEGLVVGLEAPATPATTPAAADTPQSRALAALRAADSVIVVPGYGMAQAHAAFEVVRLANLLEKEGKQVRFAVHPVAGRMPGHMHVLLAEAEVEYEKLFEMKDINDDFASTDVVLVVGACDVVNPAAISTEDTPISGMPILKAHEAGAVIVCNLDEKPGYSGVENPLYEDPKAILLFGDAKGTLEGLVVGLEAGD